MIGVGGGWWVVGGGGGMKISPCQLWNRNSDISAHLNDAFLPTIRFAATRTSVLVQNQQRNKTWEFK